MARKAIYTDITIPQKDNAMVPSHYAGVKKREPVIYRVNGRFVAVDKLHFHEIPHSLWLKREKERIEKSTGRLVVIRECPDGTYLSYVD